MRRSNGLACGLGLTFLVVHSPAFCAPNGLTQIPIAKVFGDGVASFSVARARQQTQSTVVTAQYGIGNDLEIGLDYQSAPADQKTFLGNAKFLLAHRPGRLPDVAVGLLNVAGGQKAVPYAVATTQPRAAGFSLGVIRPNAGSAYYDMAGLSYSVSPTCEIVGDEIGGRAGYGTLGVIASLTKTITLNLAYARPNAAQAAGTNNPRGYVFNLAYTFHLKGGANGGGPKNPTAAGS